MGTAFLMTALACAQPAATPKRVFPNDSQDPKLAGGAELLEAVCPGHVVVGEAIECKIVCPEFTSFKGEEYGWRLTRITRGHFLSSISDDAVLSMGGCEPHSFNFGGTILLSKRSGKWAMHWYKGGIPTEQCHRARLETGRQFLICLGESGGQGLISTELYVEDLLSPKGALMAGEPFLGVQDTMLTCGYDYKRESKPFLIRREYIERVAFHSATDGTLRGLSVFARRGERTLTVVQVQECIDEGSPVKPHRGLNFDPPTKPYRIDFKFDGKRMVRVGSSPGNPK